MGDSPSPQCQKAERATGQAGRERYSLHCAKTPNCHAKEVQVSGIRTTRTRACRIARGGRKLQQGGIRCGHEACIDSSRTRRSNQGRTGEYERTRGEPRVVPSPSQHESIGFGGLSPVRGDKDKPSPRQIDERESQGSNGSWFGHATRNQAPGHVRSHSKVFGRDHGRATGFARKGQSQRRTWSTQPKKDYFRYECHDEPKHDPRRDGRNCQALYVVPNARFETKHVRI
mmetsp:Transcript_13956/g.28817  ORF Transcript_13956/g.28817 Transcript_13956/m.28817 type:complete len:229 (+) Transcript_13956:1370-2056(+)